jgi:hypothetical protein
MHGGDSSDFFQNVWIDNGWSAVDKLIQDAERDDPGVLSSNIHQDFFDGRTSGRYSSKDQFLNASMGPQSLKMRQPHSSYLPLPQQPIQRSLPPMMPPLQYAQSVDSDTSLKHETNTLLTYAAPSYDTMRNNNGSSSLNMSSGNSQFDWGSIPQAQYLQATNPFYEQHPQQQFYPPQQGIIDNRNIFGNNTYNDFENFQHQQLMFQQHNQQQQMMQQQQQHELQRRYHQQQQQQQYQQPR